MLEVNELQIQNFSDFFFFFLIIVWTTEWVVLTPLFPMKPADLSVIGARPGLLQVFRLIFPQNSPSLIIKAPVASHCPDGRNRSLLQVVVSVRKNSWRGSLDCNEAGGKIPCSAVVLQHSWLSALITALPGLSLLFTAVLLFLFATFQLFAPVAVNNRVFYPY